MEMQFMGILHIRKRGQKYEQNTKEWKKGNANCHVYIIGHLDFVTGVACCNLYAATAGLRYI